MPARVDLEINVFRESLDQVETLGKRSSTLEPNIEICIVERPESVSDPIVLLYQTRTQALFGRNQYAVDRATRLRKNLRPPNVNSPERFVL